VLVCRGARFNEVSEIAQVKRQKADEECHWMRELRIEENKSHESVKHILSEARAPPKIW